MRNTIINEFKTEEDLRKVYPKKYYWELKDIFNDYWNDFVSFMESKNKIIRPVVFKEVEKMIKCKTKVMGYSTYECPNCHKTLNVYNTCKGRFCNSCGVKYSKQRTEKILSTLVDVPHRHLTFTIPDFLWPLFLEDRERLQLMFKAVSETLISWCKELNKKENFKPGFILVLHTFGRDDKWNVHIHCLLAEVLLGNTKEKKLDFIPFDMLRNRFRTILLNLLEQNIGKRKFYKTKCKCYNNYKDGFYVRAKKNEFPNSRKGLEYILRYCGRPCFAQYRIIDIRDDYITFWYQRHGDDMFVVERIHLFEFFARLIRHIPDTQFKTIRYYGFYSSTKHKLYDTCRKVVSTIKAEFHKTMTKWRNLILISFKRDPLKCSCGTIMEFICSFPRLE